MISKKLSSQFIEGFVLIKNEEIMMHNSKKNLWILKAIKNFKSCLPQFISLSSFRCTNMYKHILFKCQILHLYPPQSDPYYISAQPHIVPKMYTNLYQCRIWLTHNAVHVVTDFAHIVNGATNVIEVKHG